MDSAGNLYVTDSGATTIGGGVKSSQIQKFTSNGVYITKWGILGPGDADGQFQNPSDVAVDSADNIYVTDTDHNRVQKFTSFRYIYHQIGYFWLR